MRTPALFSSCLKVAMACVGALVMAGCNTSPSWDREYACQGQERATAQVADSTSALLFDKSYPIEIDFHMRSGVVMVKSYQVKLDAERSGHVAFSSSSPAMWMSGDFDPQTGALALIESRSLLVDGKSQENRISGQYQCRARGSVVA